MYIYIILYNIIWKQNSCKRDNCIKQNQDDIDMIHRQNESKKHDIGECDIINVFTKEIFEWCV